MKAYVLLAFILVYSQAEEFVIGNGEKSSCSFDAINQIFQGQKNWNQTLPQNNVTKIRFSCGQNPHTIEWKAQIFVWKNVEIDGQQLITFDGLNKTRFFVISTLDLTWGVSCSGCKFFLKNLMLINGGGGNIPVGR